MRYAPGFMGRARFGMPRSPCQPDQSRLSKCAGSFIRCSTLALPSTRIPPLRGLKDGMLQCCAKYLSISAASYVLTSSLPISVQETSKTNPCLYASLSARVG